jgi:hypothetical protein
MVPVSVSDLHMQVPLHLTNDFNEKACSDSFMRRSVVVDFCSAKIETRIR